MHLPRCRRENRNPWEGGGYHALCGAREMYFGMLLTPGAYVRSGVKLLAGARGEGG